MVNEERIKELKLLLKDLFQFENNDLDFGIYRIINIKKKEISEFIDHELFEIISEGIKTVEGNTGVQKSLESLKKEIESTFGCEIQEAKKKYAETPKVRDYLDKEKELKIADKENDIEEEIYDDIINFFSRYYDNGDFISKRRYSKENKYAIPYNGEEVYLYWANNDQYYIKTTEKFKTYLFTAGDTKVNFEIVSEDVDVEKNNIKDSKNKFFLFNDAEYDPKNKILSIKFGYRGLIPEEEKETAEITKKTRIGKDEVNKYNLQKIQERIGIYGLSNLQKKHIKMDGEKSESSELEWHLNKYTTKNTSDYFIHKNLKRFLGQELDFYIKNELLHIDDIDSKEDLNINLKRIRVLKEISLKIIEFLAQVEEFQKKFWEKKKFVISTDYCITLDYVDEKYYPEILKNKAQLEEWNNSFSFDVEAEAKKLKGKLTGVGKGDEENKLQLLKENPTLVIDTKFYDVDFKYQLLSNIDNIDEKTTGILINSDNFHALNLLLNKYERKIKCCYIDPPYNTGNDGFLYKDGFSHSSWLSLLSERLEKGKVLLSLDGVIFASIDDNENVNLRYLFDRIFGSDNFESQIIVQSNKRGQTYKSVAKTHEYLLLYGASKEAIINELPKEIGENSLKDENGPYELWELRNRNPKFGRFNRPNLFYPIYVNPNSLNEEGYAKISLYNTKEYDVEVFPLNSEGKDSCWRWGTVKVSDAIKNNDYSILIAKKKRDGGWNIYEKSRKSGTAPKSLWTEKEMINEQGTVECNKLGLREFGFPKPVSLIKQCVQIGSQRSDYVIDFFAGSGTTGHSVLKLNKEDSGSRKFILVEMGQYFDTVTKPRILKVIYSDNWKNGKPLDNDGSKKQIIKYQTLEQYEDSLNNIDFKQPNKLALESKDYNIKYMLDFESRDNNVFLNLDALNNPFEYRLKVENNNEIKEFNIDLVETFNYIAGIDVKKIQKKQDQEVDYIIVKGQRNEKDVIVIWRNKSEGFDPIRDKEFVQKEILTEEYDEILVNGNSLIPYAKSVDEIFKANMFEGYNV
ncbi:site-specific DNA-methyltransferase [Methanosarcina sp. 1.H.A.2.2]|uniref:site-specific DNA-methyltransferase n=1 Tax=Methanosarcina sp. 1.H.A.2.2 TaxID=1483601 RepID=UPI000621B884|nr:site-specific DNA-methyltransferase [Methanosarcina sp. 1.H.A.2.2]KKH47543.1 DNA methylase [Methanosarcina sp. 1.H.A.2.2]